MAPDVQPPDPASKPTPDPSPEGESPAEALRDVWARIAELRTEAGYFLAAKIDQAKLSIRQLIVLAMLGVLGLIVVAGAMVTAVVLLLRGVAGALAALCGANLWLGDLLCGGLFLAAMGLGLWISVKRINKMSRDATVKKYESR